VNFPELLDRRFPPLPYSVEMKTLSSNISRLLSFKIFPNLALSIRFKSYVTRSMTRGYLCTHPTLRIANPPSYRLHAGCKPCQVLDRGKAAGHGLLAIIRRQWWKKGKLGKHVL